MINLNFETLTPLHISNGNQLAYNLEYIIMNDFVAKLNLQNASKALVEANCFDYNRNYKFYEIIKIIENNKHLFNERCFDYKVDALENFIEYINGEKRDGQKIIQEFINSNGNFYIPGSSIKGMLTTVLNRDPDKNPLGINPNSATIKDKFVITDSAYIDSDCFVVDVLERPPSINLITLDPGIEFSSTIRRSGNLDISKLRKNLEGYSIEQLKKAFGIVKRFKEMEKKPGGAANYHNILNKMINEINLDNNEYLVNMGFGGGSYYKLFSNAPIPKFKNPGRRGKREEAHTTFNVNIDNELFQLGWCKLKIEEE